MEKPKLLYYSVLNYHETALELLHSKFYVLDLSKPTDDTDEVLQKIDILMAPLDFQVDANKIDKCPNLKIIASSTLSVPHIDVDYAEKKNITVISLAGEEEFLKSISPTAELTWGLIIVITRQLFPAYNSVLGGKWEGRSFGEKTPKMLSNMTLGIVGLGRLGSIVASYGKAFGMKVYYFSPNSRNNEYHQCNTLRELAECSDIVSIHAHHIPETEGMIDKYFFKAMKKGSFFVNTARGEIVNENDLYEALESGHLGGAGLDVLAGERKTDFKQIFSHSKLVRYAKKNDNLVITPHFAGATIDAWEKTQTKTIELVINNYEYKRSKQ